MKIEKRITKETRYKNRQSDKSKQCQRASEYYLVMKSDQVRRLTKDREQNDKSVKIKKVEKMIKAHRWK